MMFDRGKWNKLDYNELLEYMMSIQDIKYRDFNKKLIPGTENIIGIRVPNLRKLSKEISQGNWKEFLEVAEDTHYEEVRLQGMVIGNINSNFEETLYYVKRFIPKIDNWSVCDGFCSDLKSMKKYKENMYDILKKYVYSKNPWEIRFALVMFLIYYVDDKHIKEIFEYCNNIQSEEYYVKMGMAWLLSICFIKCEEETFLYIKNNNLDDFTYNKMLQKIIESNRVDLEKKNIIRSMKRKTRRC
ncbi:DNA alkylation repair protein [Clostridioides difficile]|nr:DNA alkylation repair protein [Clostridioides difficile]ELX4522385.1 DNA alkylation repair protein [Clostridioides difficile]MCO8785152.1 DNA alkylation repair protein [Clostridioides difficile]MCO8825081.1 DNA alkylation repair protein [Clostridioides difficile]MCW0580645.1 DNA alkylation repair protein [Clostridioides difficile]